LYAGGYFDVDRFQSVLLKWNGYRLVSGQFHQPANNEPLELGKIYFAINSTEVLETRNIPKEKNGN